METLESLGNRIATTHDLRAVVRTMKSLSAVSIRPYERAVGALADYRRTVDLALQVALAGEPPPRSMVESPKGVLLAVVFGSDHGLCGRFNQEIGRFARTEVDRRGGAARGAAYVAVGARVTARLETAGADIVHAFALPGSVEGLARTAQDLLLGIDRERHRREIGPIVVIHNRPSDEATAEPYGFQLHPLELTWLKAIAARPWPSRRLPGFTMERAALLAAVVRQHLFLGLFRAAAQSAASEHATRLRAMQAAERNIEERLDEMNAAYRHQRQAVITSELLDVVSGFEALTGDLEEADESPEATP